MVNYDLPWNPNRIEQRFGRIHRIGQQMVCHLWNLVAPQTREGEVFGFLLRKLEEARQALGGRVFDVLGQLRFNDRPLREVLLEAVRYGDTPEVRARFHEKVEGSVDLAHFQELLENQALAVDAMDSRRIRKIKVEMELAEARRMQPHFIESFFKAALKELGGEIYPREEGRFEITRVPAVMRSQELELNSRMGVLLRYQRVTFEKEKETIPGLPQAEFVCPGNPVLSAAIEVLLQRYGGILRQGTILVDDASESLEPRALILMEHEIRDGRRDTHGQNLLVSKKLQFVEVSAKEVAVMDSIGAGDTFAAALITQLLEKTLMNESALEKLSSADLTEILNNCSMAAAITCSRQGANPPHRHEVTW
jgi:hypothetical protein